MFTLPQEPRNCLQILYSSFKFWETYYSKLAVLVVLTVAFGTLPGFIVPRFPKITAEITVKFVVTHWLFIFVYLLMLLFLFSALTHRSYSLLYQKNYSIRDSLLVALKKLPYLFVADLIYSATVMLGVAMFLIPGIGLMVLLSMYFILIIVDNETPISGFKKSWLLVTDHWFHTFAVLLILTIFIFVIGHIVGKLTADLWVFVHPLGVGELPLGNRLIRIAADMFFFPFYATTLIMLYHDLTLRAKIYTDQK